MTTGNAAKGIVLHGLDGANPLGFLAALGTLRSLSLAWPNGNVRLAWTEQSAGWRPEITAVHALDADSLVTELHKHLSKMKDHSALTFADNLNVTCETYRHFAESCILQATADDESRDTVAAEFAAAFACDALKNEQNVIQDSALRTLSGAGHQHFLATMRRLVEDTTKEQLRVALFETWRYNDPVTNQTLRWDPIDDVRYALQWRDPSGDPARKKGGTMVGANRLAIEGIPLLTAVPIELRIPRKGKSATLVLRTAGFKGIGSRDTCWTWPIWLQPTSLDVCRSVIAQAELVSESDSIVALLKRRGIAAIFQSQRITVGKFRNFTPGVAIA